MPGIGTIVNTIAVIVGGIIGLMFKRGLDERFQTTIMQATGLSVIFIGISGAMEKMLILSSSGSVVSDGGMAAAVSLAAGAVIGELINIEKRLNRFGDYLRLKAGRGEDSRFIDGFVMTSLTICVGAMAVIGSIQDGLMHDPSTLFTKAVLDGVIVIIFASGFGPGAVFSAIPLFIFQGSVTLLAGIIRGFLTDAMLDGISMVGSMLIFCVGANLIFPVKIKVANMLPALVIIAIYVSVF